MTVSHSTYLDACTCALRNMRMMEMVATEKWHAGQHDATASHLTVFHHAQMLAIGECIAALKSEMEAVRLAVDK